MIGVKGFTYFFNLFFGRILRSVHGSAISAILSFSLLTSAVALLLGIIRDYRKDTYSNFNSDNWKGRHK